MVFGIGLAICEKWWEPNAQLIGTDPTEDSGHVTARYLPQGDPSKLQQMT